MRNREVALLLTEAMELKMRNRGDAGYRMGESGEGKDISPKVNVRIRKKLENVGRPF